MEHHDARKIFTPTTVARLTFVERNRINDRLTNALTTPGKQIVVFGRPGSGKTTLLENKLYQVYEHHITSTCTESTTLAQCLLDAFEQLGPFFLKTKPARGSSTEDPSPKENDLAAPTPSKNGKTVEPDPTQTRTLPPLLTPPSLARLLEAAHACWILEDFHKVQKTEKIKLAQLMRLFTHLSEELPNARIIAIGTAGSTREILICEPMTWNRVSEIEVDLMTDRELSQIVKTGENLLNIRFPESTKEAIIRYSNSLPSTCHQLCLNMCLMEGIVETQPHLRTLSEENLGEAVRLWLEIRGGNPSRRGTALRSSV